jgi:prepilin-type processing-associated H-X9-DG protein
MRPRQVWFALMAFSLAGPLQAQEKSIESTEKLLRQLADQYVPSEAAFAGFIAPQELLKRPGMELFPYEVIEAGGKRDLGFNPATLDVIILFGTMTEQGQPFAGMVMHSTVPLKADGLMPSLAGSTEDGSIAGKKFRRALDVTQPSYCLIDERTILFSPESSLQAMLEAKQPSPLRELLTKATLKNDVTVMATLEPLRGVITQLQRQASQLPPPFQPLLKIPDHIQHAQLTLNARDGIAVRLALLSQDDANAKKLVQLLETARAFGKQAALMQLATQPKTEDAVELAGRQYMKRMIEAQSELLAPKIQGNRVELRYELDSGIATTGTMIAVLLPALQTAREAARRAQSSNNLREIGLALHRHLAEHREFPAYANFDSAGRPLLSWRVHILPYLGLEQLYQEFHLDEPWDSAHNRKLIPRMPGAFRSPHHSSETPGETVYLAIRAESSLIGDTPRKVTEITDGLSLTLAALEANAEQAVPWTKPEDLDVSADDPLDGIGAWHSGGTTTLFADGSLHFLNTDADAFLRMTTINGGEPVEMRKAP